MWSRFVSTALGLFLLGVCCCNGLFTVTKEDNINGNRWALLVAGSNSWINYRHQADICHAYQILHAHSIPDSNIIVMMYDDIANNTQNKLPGKIINRPWGPDVYGGVVKDYIGEDLTPQNFLNVLRGNASAMADIGSGKVLNSQSNDRVFINLVDHGGPGIFNFPNEYLSAKDFIDTLIWLHEQRKFKEMVVYIESCESGSMFENLLPENIKVYGLSASSPTEPSFGCYMDDFLDNLVGDLFSVKWMEDVDIENIDLETLEENFEIVFSETNQVETPTRYGDLIIDTEVLSNFLGHQNTNKRRVSAARNYLDKLKMESKVESTNVPFAILEHKLKKAASKEEEDSYKKEMSRLHKNRKFVADKMDEIVFRVTWREDLTKTLMDISQQPKIVDWDCYKKALSLFHSKCFNLGKNPFVLQLVGVFSKLCDEGYLVEQIEKAVDEVCNFPTVVGVI